MVDGIGKEKLGGCNGEELDWMDMYVHSPSLGCLS